MYVCIHVQNYYICMYVLKYISLYVCMHMYVCICMCVSVFVLYQKILSSSHNIFG